LARLINKVSFPLTEDLKFGTGRPMKIRCKTSREVAIYKISEVARKYQDTFWGTGIMDKLIGQGGQVAG